MRLRNALLQILVAGIVLAGLCAAADKAPVARYRHRDGVLLPDPKYTPGLVRTTNPKDPAICGNGTTSTYRATTEKMKREVCELYGVEECPREGKLEIDHLISLELGGADDVKNLWPQPAKPTPGFHEKDLVEGWLNREVCKGELKLTDAQKGIAGDWYAEYKRMVASQKDEGAK